MQTIQTGWNYVLGLTVSPPTWQRELLKGRGQNVVGLPSSFQTALSLTPKQLKTKVRFSQIHHSFCRIKTNRNQLTLRPHQTSKIQISAGTQLDQFGQRETRYLIILLRWTSQSHHQGGGKIQTFVRHLRNQTRQRGLPLMKTLQSLITASEESFDQSKLRQEPE